MPDEIGKVNLVMEGEPSGRILQAMMTRPIFELIGPTVLEIFESRGAELCLWRQEWAASCWESVQKLLKGLEH